MSGKNLADRMLPASYTILFCLLEITLNTGGFLLSWHQSHFTISMKAGGICCMLFFSIINLILLLIGLFVMGMCIYALYLAIKALKIYISKNT